MLTIFVGSRKQNLGMTDGKVMKTYPLLIKEGDTFSYLNDRLDCLEVDDVELVIKYRFWPFWSRRLSLPSYLKKSIVEFLHNYHAKGILHINCHTFACMVAGMPQVHEGGRWKSLWKIKRWSVRRRPGDVVILENSELGVFRHAAVYIGFGLWLSVYGGGGDLEVATLEDMRRDYNATDVFNVVPI